MQTMREREREEVLGDERFEASAFAGGFAMVGLLVGLFAFFVAFAPGA
jgi:hypothetical protein